MGEADLIKDNFKCICEWDKYGEILYRNVNCFAIRHQPPNKFKLNRGYTITLIPYCNTEDSIGE